MSHHDSQLQLMHSCITASRGLSPMARKKRMFFRTFFTWKNTFFATLSLKQQKQGHMGCFWTYKHSCMFMYISSELHYFSLYKYNKLARQNLKSLHTKILSSLSREYSRNIHKSSSTKNNKASFKYLQSLVVKISL